MEHERFIFKPGTRKGLAGFDPEPEGETDDENIWQARTEADIKEIAVYQQYLMAHEKHGLLIIFQGMDAAGKDEAIRSVMSRLDPQGTELKMFKPPTEKERRHDYMWPAMRSVPARGQVGIFNRSYYEHVVADRIRPSKLDEQNLPKGLTGKDIWERRCGHMRNYEEYLHDEGIRTLKFFLNVSKENQAEKLLERIDRPDKKWQFSMDDIEDRRDWNKFMKAYEEAFELTSTDTAPWYIIPANRRWYGRASIASIILETLRSLHKKFPAVDKEQASQMDDAKEQLSKELKK